MAVVSPDPFDFTNLLVHTQGSLAEGQFKSYVDSLLSGADRARIKNWYRINGPHTLIFEALHPEDKHIVEYGPEDFGLCLIGCRDLSPNGGYRVLSETELDEIASTVGFSRPTRFVAPLSEIMTLRKTSKNMEGWMVRDIKTGAHLSKIKTAHYLVTKFLGRMSEGNWKFLMTNKQGFVEKNQIDEEFLPPRRLRVRQSGAIL